MVSWGLLGVFLDFTLLSSLLSDQSQHQEISKDVHFCLLAHQSISGRHYLSYRQISPIVSKLVSSLFTFVSPEYFCIQYQTDFINATLLRCLPWLNGLIQNPWYGLTQLLSTTLASTTIHSLDMLVPAKVVSCELLKYTGLCTSSSLYLESSPSLITPDKTRSPEIYPICSTPSLSSGLGRTISFCSAQNMHTSFRNIHSTYNDQHEVSGPL